MRKKKITQKSAGLFIFNCASWSMVLILVCLVLFGDLEGVKAAAGATHTVGSDSNGNGGHLVPDAAFVKAIFIALIAFGNAIGALIMGALMADL